MALKPIDAYLLVDFSSFETRMPTEKIQNGADSILNLIGQLPIATTADPTTDYDRVLVDWKTDPVDDLPILENNGTNTQPIEMRGHSFLIKGTLSDGVTRFTIKSGDQHGLKFNGTTYTVDEATAALRAQLDPLALVAGIDEANAEDPWNGILVISRDVQKNLYKQFENNLKEQTGR